MTVLKILVVDDNAEVGDSFAQAFAALGCEVKVIGSRGRCLTTLPGDWRPDRVLIDASMPEGWIRQIRGRFPVPTVGITGGPVTPAALADVKILEKPSQPAAVLAELEKAGDAVP